tara:strand:+ start:10682 stop:11461 length:780 start_codon:yes stop_codon:yes gene_type:complete
MKKNHILEYKEYGYTVVKDVLPKSSIQTLTDTLDAVFTQSLEVLSIAHEELDLHNKMYQLLIHDKDAYIKVLSSLSRLLALQEFLYQPAMLNMIKSMFAFDNIYLPGATVINTMSNRLKIPNGYFGFEPHQDYATTQGSKESVVCWVPLVDIEINMFPLQVLRKSHQSGLFPLEDKGHVFATKPEYYDKNAFITLTCKAGDVVLMDIFTLHRTSMLGDERLRMACSTRFDNGINTDFVTDHYPTGLLRSVKRDHYKQPK